MPLPDLGLIRIYGFSHVYLAVSDLSGSHLPGLIRTDHFPAAVLIEKMELRKGTGPAAVKTALQHETENAFIPAVSDDHLQCRLVWYFILSVQPVLLRIFIFGHIFTSVLQQLRNIMDLVLQAVMVAGPPGGHALVPDTHSIQVRLIDSPCRGIEPGLLHRSF